MKSKMTVFSDSNGPSRRENCQRPAAQDERLRQLSMAPRSFISGPLEKSGNSDEKGHQLFTRAIIDFRRAWPERKKVLSRNVQPPNLAQAQFRVNGERTTGAP